MSLRGFQQALVDLTVVAARAGALRRGEAAMLAGYDLSERERQRLVDIVRQPGMAVTCSLSRGNRMEVIVGVFPMTCVLLKPLLRGLLDELWEEHKPANYQLAGEEQAFAAFLERKIADGLAVEYLAEVFAYERVCWELAQLLRARHGPTMCEATVAFEHPPEQLLPPLSRLTAPPAGLPRGSYAARVKLTEAGLEVDRLATASGGERSEGGHAPGN